MKSIKTLMISTAVCVAMALPMPGVAQSGKAKVGKVAGDLLLISSKYPNLIPAIATTMVAVYRRDRCQYIVTKSVIKEEHTEIAPCVRLATAFKLDKAKISLAMQKIENSNITKEQVIDALTLLVNAAGCKKKGKVYTGKQTCSDIDTIITDYAAKIKTDKQDIIDQIALNKKNDSNS